MSFIFYSPNFEDFTLGGRFNMSNGAFIPT